MTITMIRWPCAMPAYIADALTHFTQYPSARTRNTIIHAFLNAPGSYDDRQTLGSSGNTRCDDARAARTYTLAAERHITTCSMAYAKAARRAAGRLLLAQILFKFLPDAAPPRSALDTGAMPAF